MSQDADRAIFFKPIFILSSSLQMKQQAVHSISPERNQRFKKEDTAIFLVLPDIFIQMSIREGPFDRKRGGMERVERSISDKAVI